VITNADTENEADSGPLGHYLIKQLRSFNETYHPRPIEFRSPGDSPAVELILFPPPEASASGPPHVSARTAPAFPTRITRSASST
jgi:hypothetical protein